MKKTNLFLLAAALLCAVSVKSAALTLASPFSDNAVIQRDIEAPIWGQAEAGAEVEISVEKDGATVRRASAVADENGKWLAKLSPMKAGGPYTVNIKTPGEQIAIANILFGDIWICSGQSNMEMSYRWGLTRGKEDIETTRNSNIRLLNVPNKTSVTPLTAFDAKWEKLAPDSGKNFSAVGYFFGAAIAKELEGVPVGLIDITWSGTFIHTWMSLDAIEKTGAWKAAEKAAKHREEVAKFLAGEQNDAFLKPSPHVLSACYNGMFAPVFPLAIKGAIWYQGCNNVGDEKSYFLYFKELAADWRSNFSGGDFPIYLVQLAAFQQTNENPIDSAWARMRWTMTRLGEEIKNCGTAVAIDVGHPTDIHPKDKKTVGERLARLALHRTYGRADIVEAGPIPLTASKTEDGGVRITFKNAAGLKTTDNAPVAGFQVVGADGKTRWADARIKDDAVIVSLPDDIPAAEIRHAWDDFPVCNLYNAADLPAGPFQMKVE